MPKFSSYPVVTTLAPEDTFLIHKASVNSEKQVSMETLKNAISAQVFSILALKALDVSKFTDNQTVMVLGYYAPGDGGDGFFYYDSANVSTDNGGTIIEPDVGAGRWLRVVNSWLSVREFGAKGDGVTDDTNAIMSAVNLSIASTYGYKVYIPQGVYIVSGVTIRGSDITIFGDGSSITTLKRKGSSTACNVLEIGDTAAGNSASEYVHINVSGLTLDGNKANVTQPSSDLTDWGIPTTKISYSNFHDIRAINCWNGGVGTFINSNYNSWTAIYCFNCGVGNTFGGGTTEPGFDVNSSKYNRISVITESCRDGFRLLDNCFGNICDAVVKNATTTGVIFGNQSTNESFGNIVNATITGGCSAQGMSLSSNFRQNTFNLTIEGVSGVGVNDVYNATYKSQGNQFNVATRLCGGQSCLIGNAGNTWNITSVDDGVGIVTPGDLFAVDVQSGATKNLIAANITDTRATVKIRGLVFQAGSTYNRLVSAQFTTVFSDYTDNGTGNTWDDKPMIWADATLGGGWSNAYGAPRPAIGYLVDPRGYVWLRGNASGAGTGVIFTLPTGYRPSSELLFGAISPNDQTGQIIQVATNGQVSLAVATNFITALSGVSFPTT